MNELPLTVDVAIVGGGFAGMSTAWWLARKQVRDVIVLEREPELGVYASGRSAGLGRQLCDDDAVTGMTVVGAARLREHFPQVWTETGGVLSFEDKKQVKDYPVRALRFGLSNVTRMKRESVTKLWPQLAGIQIEAAIRVPTDGVIDIVKLLAAYADGARVMRGVAVERIEPAIKRGARLLTNRGEITARVVVDATGAWAGRTTGDALLESLKRHVYVLEAVPPPNAPFLWHLGSRELYVRGDGDRILISPCDATKTPPGNQKPDAAGEAKLRGLLEHTPLARSPIARAWACQRTFPRTWAVKIDRDEQRPWLVWAAGLGGHGATSSPVVGETVGMHVIEALG